MYILCRSQELFTVEKNTSNNKSKRIVVPWVTGFHSLPNDGGVLDQPYRLMEYFREFMSADRKHANDKIST